ncbi:MAG: hypothetical protein GY820_44260 [Gammaproteobacteria bacterium]|nr:hypothetical protein [Gammaproteobacteria bacterium]
MKKVPRLLFEKLKTANFEIFDCAFPFASASKFIGSAHFESHSIRLDEIFRMVCNKCIFGNPWANTEQICWSHGAEFGIFVKFFTVPSSNHNKSARVAHFQNCHSETHRSVPNACIFNRLLLQRSDKNAIGPVEFSSSGQTGRPRRPIEDGASGDFACNTRWKTRRNLHKYGRNYSICIPFDSSRRGDFKNDQLWHF